MRHQYEFGNRGAATAAAVELMCLASPDVKLRHGKHLTTRAELGFELRRSFVSVLYLVRLDFQTRARVSELVS